MASLINLPNIRKIEYLSLSNSSEILRKRECFQTYFTKSAFSSVQFSRSVMSNYLRPHEPKHARPPCLSPTPRAYSNSCPLSQWCHPAISSSVVPFSSCPQSLPASGSFLMNQLFASGGQSIGVSASASVLCVHCKDWCWSWNSNTLATWCEELIH